MAAAAENYRQAADKAGPLAQADPSIKLRRADWLLARITDAQQSARQFEEAAATVSTGHRRECRAAAARGRASAAGWPRPITWPVHSQGEDDACQQAYPKNSPLLAAVLFRHAETPSPPLRSGRRQSMPNGRTRRQRPQLYGEALKRYQKAVEKFPEHTHVNLAPRQGLALAHYRLSGSEEAGKVLASIAEAEPVRATWPASPTCWPIVCYARRRRMRKTLSALRGCWNR